MLRRVCRFFRWLESAILVALFLALLLVAVTQVLLRNIGELSFGLSWGDEFVSMAVLWITLVGAMLAVRENGHIRIDFMEGLLTPLWSKVSTIIANVCACSICLVVAGYSIQFVWSEYTMPTTDGIGLIPFWLLVSIFPFAFSIMGIRFALSIFSKPDE